MYPVSYTHLDVYKRQVEISAYHTFSFEPDHVPLAERAEQIRQVVTESVDAHQISDVEVGAFLSGGIDSSVIACLSRCLLYTSEKCGRLAGPLRSLPRSCGKRRKNILSSCRAALNGSGTSLSCLACSPRAASLRLGTQTSGRSPFLVCIPRSGPSALLTTARALLVVTPRFPHGRVANFSVSGQTRPRKCWPWALPCASALAPLFGNSALLIRWRAPPGPAPAPRGFRVQTWTPPRGPCCGPGRFPPQCPGRIPGRRR